MPRTRVKICGVRTEEAAFAAARAGADAVGFVFHPQSQRFIEPEDAADISIQLPPFVSTVAVFFNVKLDKFMEYEEVCPTTGTQFSGDEREDLVRECAPVIKAVLFTPETIGAQLARWATVDEVDAILVDAPGPAAWEPLAAAVRGIAKPIILGGGLSPENVADAIRAVRPYGVDVSAGVETSPGLQDPARIEAFCRAVRRVDAEIG